MISRIRVPVPMPDAVADLVEEHLPTSVRDADVAARVALREVRRSRSEEHREDQEDALADLARANKILAAHNPGLIVRLGGAR